MFPEAGTPSSNPRGLLTCAWDLGQFRPVWASVSSTGRPSSSKVPAARLCSLGFQVSLRYRGLCCVTLYQ